MEGGVRSCCVRGGCHACVWAELQLHVLGEGFGGGRADWSTWELCASLQRIQVGWIRACSGGKLPSRPP